MTAQIVWRLMWKEYRGLRAFWLSVAAVCVAIQLLMVIFADAENWRHAGDLAGAQLMQAVFFVAIYGLGAAAILFAREREEGTRDYLAMLPGSAFQVALGKLALLATSMLLLLAVLLAFAMGTFALHSPSVAALWNVDLRQVGGAVIGVAAILAHVTVWGLLCALVGRHTIRTVVAAGVLSVAAAWASAEAGTKLTTWFGWRPANTGLVVTLIVEAITLVAVMVLAATWLRPTRGMNQFVSGWTDAARGVIARWRAMPRDAVEPRAAIGRLVWHALRQSRTLVVIASLWLPVLLFLARSGGVGWFVLLLVLGLAIALLIGATTFLADQQSRCYRFFAEHAIDPRRVWLARQIVSLPLAIVPAALAGAIIAATDLENVRAWLAEVSDWLHVSHMSLVGMYVAIATCAYAAGQFTSMFIRSGILAVSAAFPLTMLLAAWAVLMARCGISWTWSVMPLAASLLAATYVRSTGWILERNGLRHWLAAFAPVAVVAVFLAIAVPWHRATEIPAVESPFDPTAPKSRPSTAALETGRMYLEAWESLPVASEFEAVDVNDDTRSPQFLSRKHWNLREAERSIELLLAASRRDESSLAPLTEATSDVYAIGLDFVTLLVQKAIDLESHGKLDEAWRHYQAALRTNGRFAGAFGMDFAVWHALPYWAARDGQTRERIRDAIDWLEAWRTSVPSAIDEKNYLHVRNIITNDPSLSQEIESQLKNWNSDAWQIRLVHWLPWERQRTLRLLNLVSAVDARSVASVESQLRRGGAYQRPSQNVSEVAFALYELGAPSTVLATTLMAQPWLESHDKSLTDFLASSESTYRATLLITAIEGYKAEHGALPLSLDDLRGREEGYFEHLPRDSWSGQPFRYFRQGILLQTPAFDRAVMPLHAGRGLKAGQPCLWAPARRDLPTQTQSDFDTLNTLSGDSIEHANPNQAMEHAAKVYEVLAKGRFYPIP